jgi:hypothetical protein
VREGRVRSDFARGKMASEEMDDVADDDEETEEDEQ